LGGRRSIYLRPFGIEKNFNFKKLMKITIELLDQDVSWEHSMADDLPSAISGFKGLLVGLGFNPVCVDECFSEDTEKWNIELKDKDERIRTERLP
jgi:hypothetical protein